MASVDGSPLAAEDGKEAPPDPGHVRQEEEGRLRAAGLRQEEARIIDGIAGAEVHLAKVESEAAQRQAERDRLDAEVAAMRAMLAKPPTGVRPPTDAGGTGRPAESGTGRGPVRTFDESHAELGRESVGGGREYCLPRQGRKALVTLPRRACVRHMNRA